MASPFYVRSNRGTQWPTSSSYYNRPFSNVDPPLTLFRTGPNRGLCNLGNTCFMNSAIQCLSYTHPLTVYFLEQEYKKDINEDNPLGMGGNVAEAYHKLLIEMWSEQYWSYSPSPFKSVIERFAPQFCGHKQHDSQELLTFLLDGLHEDLNRVREKPDVDMDIVSEEREEEAIAAEFWDKHLQRNQSVVVDLFQGQLKTAMTCGHCNKVSKIFDPAMFLSLTLPATRINNIKVTLVRADPSAYMVEYSVEVYLEGTMADLLKKLSDMTHIQMENMMAVSTYESQFTRIYTVLDKLTDVNKGNQTMYIYELNGPVNSSDWEHVPLYHQLTVDSDYQSGSYYKRLPPPNIVSLQKKWSQEQCRAAVMDKCSSLCIHYGCEEGETHRSHTRKKSKTNRKKSWFQKLEKKITYCKGDTCVLWNWSKDDIYDPKPTLRDNSSSRSANSPTLTNCLDLFTSEKRMGETVPWYCSLCKTSGKATRKCDIWKLPQILIIHLTRFSHDRFGREKLDTFVDFPINNLNLMDYVKNPQHPTVTYDLFAVSNHHGWLTGGHYTACCKNSTNNQWYKYSDSHVIKIPEEDVVTQDAYILFYQSCSSRHATAPTPLHPPLEQSEQNVHPPKKSTLAEETQCISTEAATREQLLQKLHEANARATAAEKIVENAEQQIKQLQSKFDEFEKVRQERQAILHYATAAEQRSKSWLVSAQDVEITSEVIGIRESVQIHTAYMKVNATKIQLACQSQKVRFEQEIVIALRLSHPNLVSFYRAIQQERETTILSEPMLTNLRNEVESVRHHPEKSIPRKYLLSIAIDVSSALNYIHHLTPQPVIHRDLKSANVFLKYTSNGSWLAKISTLSHFQGQLQPQNRQESLVYAAPESSDPALVSAKVDIFSFGVLLMEMFSASFPFIEHQPVLIESIDAPIRNLIKNCMECDQNMRPSAAQLVDYINSIES